QAFQSVLVETQDGGFKSTADLSGPVFLNCPGDTIVNSTTADCKALINYLLQAEDDCSGVASIVSPNHPQNVFDAGVTSVSYVATDSVGNSTVCNFEVTVETQSTVKLKNCPPTIVQGYVTDTDCKVPVFWTEPEVTGACDFANVQINVNAEPGDSFEVNQPVLVVFVATDTINGSFDLCTWTVVVLDTIAPTLSCPKDTSLLPNTTGCAAIVGGLDPNAADNCDQSVTIASTATLPLDTFPIGTTNVQVIVSDDAGNFTFCEFKVKVIDNEAPFFVCPKDTQFVTNPNSCMATANWLTPQAFDNCDTTVLTANPSIPPGSDFAVGTTIVEYSSTDAQGNSASCTFSVTVKDEQLPTITCPSDILVNLPLTKCDTVLNWAPAFPADNCGIKSFASDVPSGTVFAAKTTLVTYTVEDNSGNTATCTFSVTVKDGVRPVISNCPKDTVVTSTDPCGMAVSWVLPTATDNCTPEGELLWSASHKPGDTFAIATTSVVITVADGSGNLDTCKFEVKVVSGVVPGFDKVPVNQTLVGCEAIATWDAPTVKGFCDQPTISSTHTSGSTFKVGTTVVTYTATDLSGTTYTATFSVTVSEMVPPVLSGCPPDSIVVNTAGTVLSGASPFIAGVTGDPNCAGATLNFLTPTATDNCGIALVEQTTGSPSGTLVPVGNSVLTFKATDASGNSTLCSVKVIVKSIALPEVMVDAKLGCPNDSVQIVAMPVIPGATYTWTGPAGAGALPNKSTITIKDLNQSKVGVYKVVVSLGTCATRSDSTTVALAEKPDAMDDFNLTIDPSKTDTFDVLINDVYNPADYKVTLMTPQTGLSQQSAGGGNFIYTSGQISGKVPFMYRICSVACPTLCDDATANITIRETDCSFVPNIITPNGDTENDVLVIPCLANSTLFRSNSIVIYNQWGDKVYEAAPYQNDWGGTLNNEPGKNLPDGTYFFIFRPGPNEAVVKGFVEIYR
ncbi:MAG TPA: HYR domain-containing protein, partial [Saprospiraceae bacterium]|nr:HYR domain-containing protein [Saprospiraceae bacterium]